MISQVSVRFLLVFVLFKYGLPRAIQTYNGIHFAGVFEGVFKRLKIPMHRSSPYFPRSHGKIDRVHRLLLDRMRRMGEAAKVPQLLPSAVFAIDSRRIPLTGGVELSTSPLELLTRMRPRNEAEIELTSLFGEPSAPEDPLPRLALLGGLRNEWTEHARETKAAATTTFVGQELKAGERVLVWSGKERRGKGKKINTGCYGARSSISMLGVPTVGTHSWKRIQEETVTLVGPMTLEESLQIRNNRLSTPATVSGIHSHSKTSKCMIMYNLPSSRGTMTRTLTLQVTRNRQHDTSRPSVQPNQTTKTMYHRLNWTGRASVGRG